MPRQQAGLRNRPARAHVAGAGGDRHRPLPLGRRPLHRRRVLRRMMDRVVEDVDDVVEHTGRSRTVLEYSLVMKRIVDEAKQPGFSVESWAPLAELIAIDEFERVGNFKEVMNWQGYVDFLTAWATSADWECSFKRITEVGTWCSSSSRSAPAPGTSPTSSTRCRSTSSTMPARSATSTSTSRWRCPRCDAGELRGRPDLGVTAVPPPTGSSDRGRTARHCPDSTADREAEDTWRGHAGARSTTRQRGPRSSTPPKP